jgi:ParB family transcriptional regulator, chromosome partitioning protein
MSRHQQTQAAGSADNDEWYTPPHIIERVRVGLGGIELDPASCAFAQQWIKADRYFTKADNGLHREWRAESVFLNPPFSHARYLPQLLLTQRSHFERMHLLTNCTYGYHWFNTLARVLPHIIFWERIAFIDEHGRTRGQPVRTQVMLFVGRRDRWYTRFLDTYSDIGKVVQP